jgi:polysaccharide biosynthesis/export protein
MKSCLNPLFVMLIAAAFSVPALSAPARGAAEDKPAEGKSRAPREPSKLDYILQPGDLIRVHVFQEDEINRAGEIRVSQEYTVNLPLIGSIDLHGKTVRQTEELVRELYDRDYLVNPQVSVNVVKYVQRVVKVFGSVGTPGVVAFPEEEALTISGAISRAGGFSRLADRRKVTLTRTAADGKTETWLLNGDDVLKGGSDDVALQPGDIINVAERIF